MYHFLHWGWSGGGIFSGVLPAYFWWNVNKLELLVGKVKVSGNSCAIDTNGSVNGCMLLSGKGERNWIFVNLFAII